MSEQKKTGAGSALAREAAESSARVRDQLQRNDARVAQFGAELRRRRPRAVVTCARGSSDHAATFARYLIETRLGLLTASAAPSVSSVYGVRPDWSGCLFLAISQSGRGPDLLAALAAAQASGALTLALVNDETSELAARADLCLPLCAGPETSVAASKSFICSWVALLHLVAHWAQDEDLQRDLASAPGLLAQSWPLDWTALVQGLAPARHAFVVGRGLGLGVAQEAALKLKEACRLHAEAFSSAEVQHGPMALLGEDFPVLMLCQDDASRAGIEEQARAFAGEGIPVYLAGASAQGATTLPTLSGPDVLQPILLVQSLYRCAAEIAAARGVDPDVPPRLRKVTRTL